MKRKWLSEISGPFTYVPPKNRTKSRFYTDMSVDLAEKLKDKFSDLFLVKLAQIIDKSNLKPIPPFMQGYSRSKYINEIIESYWKWITYLAHDCNLDLQRIGRRLYDEFNNLSGECILSIGGGLAYIYTYAKLSCTVVANPIIRWIITHIPTFTSYTTKFRSGFEIISRIYVDPVHFYELVIYRVPLNEKLITDTRCNLVHEGFTEYERREEIYRSRKSISGCRVCSSTRS